MKLESVSLIVEWSETARQLVVTDKRNQKLWKQAPFPAHIRLLESKCIPKEQRFLYSLQDEKSGLSFTLSVSLEKDTELLFTIAAAEASCMEELVFPPAFPAPDEAHFILQTDSEGMLLPVTDCCYPLEQQPIFRCSGGPAMAFLGMVDHSLTSGYMTIYETPYDAEILMKKENGLIDFGVVWKSSLGTFSYDRKIRTIFFDKGGYVAQCKRYRRYAWETNQVTTLRSKLERFPDMAKMLGAVHIYVWDTARQEAFLKTLKKSGIERAMILWNPNHLPYPANTYGAAAKNLGYAFGSYELFTDIHPDSPQRLERKKKIPFLLNCYPGKFEQLTAKTKNGDTYTNQFGHYVCPAAIRSEMQKRLEQTFLDYPDETLFLDVYQANGLYECYDEHHPLTRKGYAESILSNMKFMEDTYGIYLGSEFGADYGAGHGVYAHGMMTLQRTWFDSVATVPGSIYYIGDWKNNERPSIMLGSRTAAPIYHQYSINEYTRLPLYELVYHDAVVTSWRWEDCNHHYPELWWKKDLFNILYGNAPLWSVDESRFLEFQTTFVKSYQKIIPWLRQICLDEMTNHCFLTPDHSVQCSSFSSGKSVIVNFGQNEYLYQGHTIPARDFLIVNQ